jgi:hypothetical protein
MSLCVYNQKVIERVRIVGPLKNRERAITLCFQEGFSAFVLGPKPEVTGGFSQVEFLLLAEREVPEGSRPYDVDRRRG